MRQKEENRMAKKRKTGEDRGEAKRKTFDPLLEWGNGEGDDNLEDGDIRRWLGAGEGGGTKCVDGVIHEK